MNLDYIFRINEINIFKKLKIYKMSHFSHSNGGKLVIITGPMFAGKTSCLISELTRYVDVEVPVVYINSSDDTRGNQFSTHNSSLNQVLPKFDVLKTSKLYSLKDDVLDNYEVIAIDESQFFGDLLNFVKKWLFRNKIIYVAGLDGDIEQNIFGDIVYLIPYATEVRKLNAVCDFCRTEKKIVPAPFTIRKTDSKQKKLIGGKDIYIPVCVNHLQQSKKETVTKEEEYKFELDGLNYIK